MGVNVRPGEPTRAPDDPRIHPHLAFVLAGDPRSSRAAFERARAAARALPFELAEESSVAARQSGSRVPIPSAQARL